MGCFVTVKAMSEVGRIMGWSEKEVELGGSTLDSLLRSLLTIEGRSLYNVLVENGSLKEGYIIGINGHIATSLNTPLNSGDRVLTMEMVRLFQGG